jgi:hypothetical protein
VEVGCGGFINKKHIDPAQLLQDDAKRKAFEKVVLGARRA